MKLRNVSCIAAALLPLAVLAAPAPPMPASAPGLAASVPAAAATISGSASSAARGTMARADRNFMKEAAQGGIAEVEASRMALERGESPKVKEFAQRMVDDHTKANEELQALAASKGVTLPAQPSLTQRTQGKMLSATNPSSFDRRYAEMALADHRKTVTLFRKTARSAKDPDVMAFAAKTLPTLEHHLEMAQALQAEMKAAGTNR